MTTKFRRIDQNLPSRYGRLANWLRRPGLGIALGATLLAAQPALMAADLAAPSALLGLGDFDLAHPGAFSVGCPFSSYDSSEKNSGFLDVNALYAIADIPLIPKDGSSIRIEGDFPKVRYFSLQSYDGAKVGNLTDSLPDTLIVPTVGGAAGSNPALLPANGGYTYKYTVKIKYAAPPAAIADREPNTLYVGPPSTDAGPTRTAKLIGYRIYLSNAGSDTSGDRPLPTIYYNGPNGEINLDQTPEKAKCDRNNGLAEAFRSFNPIVVPNRNIQFVPVTMSRSGVTFGNGDAYFLRASSSLAYGSIVVIRTKRFVTPATQLPVAVDPQIRYWSLCHYNVATTAVISCIPDRDLVTQADDQQVIVLSRANTRPAAANPARGYNWIEYGGGLSEIIGLRQLLPVPGFSGSYANALLSPDLTLNYTLGDYAPDISYCDAVTFAAYADAGALALLHACHESTQR